MPDHTATCTACSQPFTFEIPVGPIGATLVRVRHRCDGCVRADRDRDDQERAARQRQADELELARRLKASGLPARVPDDLHAPATPATAAAQDWAAGRLQSLVLVGPVGVGKSTMAAAALRRRLGARAGYWRSVPVLLAHLGMGFGHPQHDQAVSLLDGRYMLALDDLDKGRPTAYVGQHVFAAIDSCYAANTPLIITSNLGLDAIAAHWADHGDAIASRLAEGTVVHMDGPDRRLIHRTAA